MSIRREPNEVLIKSVKIKRVRPIETYKEECSSCEMTRQHAGQERSAVKAAAKITRISDQRSRIGCPAKKIDKVVVLVVVDVPCVSVLNYWDDGTAAGGLGDMPDRVIKPERER